MECFFEQVFNSEDAASDAYVSFLTYLASLSENTLCHNDIEKISKAVSDIFKSLFGNRLEQYGKTFKELDERKCLEIQTYKIQVHNVRQLQIILLNSVRHFKLQSLNKNEDISVLQLLINYAVKYSKDLNHNNSVFLMRTLIYILSKRPDVLTASLSWKLLHYAHRMSVSSLQERQYAYSISRVTLPYLSNREKEILLNIDLMPFRGIDTQDLAKILSGDFIKSNKEDIIKRIFKLFKNNTESKDAACLYEKMVQYYQFDVWKADIWPLFLDQLVEVEQDGEFFQSLEKYWISINVRKYKEDFYLFLKDQQVDCKIKGLILLESRKSGCVLVCDCQKSLFCNTETINIALKVISTFNKKTLMPETREINMIMDFLYTNLDTFLVNEQLKCLKYFCSHLFFVAHRDLRKRKDNFEFYWAFVKKIRAYCCATLGAEYFEVGAQILNVLLDILTGPHTNLCLYYKLDRREMYDAAGNALYSELRCRGLWEFDSDDTILQLKQCFIENQGSSKILTDLIVQHYSKSNLIDEAIFDVILGYVKIKDVATLQNIEKISNCSRLLYKTELLDKDKFSTDVATRLQAKLKRLGGIFCETNVYECTLYCSILTTAINVNVGFRVSQSMVENVVDVIQGILDNKFEHRGCFKHAKVVEAFINSSVDLLTQYLHRSRSVVDLERILRLLIEIVQKSNMKRSVTLSFEALKRICRKMEEEEEGRMLKIKILVETLMKLRGGAAMRNLKIRRNPEARLIIYALCSTDRGNNKPLLKQALDFLIELLCDDNSSDNSVCATLHSLEILVCDCGLHGDTLSYVPDIIKCCVEIFKRPNWIVRNADLQLVKALIVRLYGVSLGLYQRPRNIHDLFTAFPGLSTYFFEILSSEKLDDRAIIVFQFFLESQTEKQVFDDEIASVLNSFQHLFVEFVKTRPNHFGKLSVLSYVSLCKPENMLDAFRDITEYVKANYVCMKKNIFLNFMYLLKALFEKCGEHKEVLPIQFLLRDLMLFLRTSNSPLFDFALLKVSPFGDIFKDLRRKLGNSFQNRLWLHNNIPFLILNAAPDDVPEVLDNVLSTALPAFMHVKVLSILISRLEVRHFGSEHLSSIVNVLFNKASELSDRNPYLLTSYFKVLLLLIEIASIKAVPVTVIPFTSTSLYKTMIFVLYYSLAPPQSFDFPNAYDLILKRYFESVGVNEETDNDIATTIIHFKGLIPESSFLKLCELVFYYSLFLSTNSEAKNFISLVTSKKYPNVLVALKDFLDKGNVVGLLGDENQSDVFYKEIRCFVDTSYSKADNGSGFYETDDDKFVPCSVLYKLLPV